MSAKDRKVAEAAFDKKQKREAELNEVLKHEDARRAAAMKNMQRLRALRNRTRREKSDRRKSQKACLICKRRYSLFEYRCHLRPFVWKNQNEQSRKHW